MFFIRWSKLSESADDVVVCPPNVTLTETSLFCQPKYWVEEVEARVSLPEKRLLEVKTLDNRTSLLGTSEFDLAEFEGVMSSGYFRDRSEYPSISWPDHSAQLIDIPINLAGLRKLSSFAVALTGYSADEYLDPEGLRVSYEKSYRLLFARWMADILKPELDAHTAHGGTRAFTTQAVVVVESFTRISQILLALAAVLIIGFGYFAVMEPLHLSSDPSTIAAHMSLIADHLKTLQFFAGKDRCSGRELRDAIRGSRFTITTGQSSSDCSIRLTDPGESAPGRKDPGTPSDFKRAIKISPKPYPYVLKLPFGVLFLGVQVGLVAAWGFLYGLDRRNNGRFVQPHGGSIC
jgi:hypothetical protein